MFTLTLTRERRADKAPLSREWLAFGFQWMRFVPVYRRKGVSKKLTLVNYLSVPFPAPRWAKVCRGGGISGVVPQSTTLYGK